MQREIRSGPIEMARCDLHGKKRMRRDLMEVPGEPGKLQCVPQARCRDMTAIRQETVICCLHGKRRNKGQMKEVGPDTWECMKGHDCRPPFTTAYPASAFRGADEEREADGGVSWSAQPQGGAQQSFVRVDNYVSHAAVIVDVWCARHGKRIPRSASVMIDGSYHVCREDTICLASALKTVEQLQQERCPEVICAIHGTLRRMRYVNLNEEQIGYTCDPAHQCRHKAVKPITSSSNQQPLASAPSRQYSGRAEGGSTFFG